MYYRKPVSATRDVMHVRNPIDKWDLRFLELATLISTWSRDPSTKVGAVIVRDRRILSTGYNGLPADVHDHPLRYTDRELKLRMTVHAERNALDFAARDVVNATIYCTAFPCAQCAASLVNTGISRVVALVNEDYESRYADDLQASRTMFYEVGIWVDQPAPISP